MQSHTPDAVSKVQRALSELTGAKRLSFWMMLALVAVTGAAAVSALRAEEEVWRAVAGPLTTMAACAILWSSCVRKIRALRRDGEL